MQTMSEWLINSLSIAIFITAFGAICVGVYLEFRYSGPYTLLAASFEQKWKWAAISMFWYTIPLPIIGLIDPILNLHDPRHWSGFPVFCTGIWVVIFPIAILFKRWGLERQLKNYHKMDKMIKSGFYQRLASSPLTGWSFRMMNLFSGAERKKFFEVGYSQENELDEEVSVVPSLLIKLEDNTKSISSWFMKRYPADSILFVSMATLLEVSKESPISWLPRLYQRRGVAIITKEFLFFKSRFLSIGTCMSVAIAFVPFTLSMGVFYLIYFLYRGTDFSSSAIFSLVILLLPALLFLMGTFAFGLSIFQYRPYQEKISFYDLQNVDIGTSPGVTRKYPSMTLTAPNKTVNVVFAKTLPDGIIQIVSHN